MRAMVDDYRSRVEIIDKARELVRGVAEKDSFAEVDAIYRWVRDRIRYVADPVDVESIATPTVTMTTRAGDCDDKATLFAALVESIGYPSRFVVAAYQRPGQLEHVYVQVLIDGHWVDADTTEPIPLGYYPDGALTLLHF